MTPEKKTPTESSIIHRIVEGEATAEEFDNLRRNLPSQPNRQEEISKALATFELRNEKHQQMNEKTKKAVFELRQAIEEMRRGTGTAERMLRDAGAAVGREAGEIPSNAMALGYRQWQELMDPERPVLNKVLLATGIAGLGWLAYRAAKWALGTKEQSTLWRILKFTGLSALAGYTVNRLGEKQRTAEVPTALPRAKKEKTAAAPAGKETAEAPKKTVGEIDLLSGKEINVDGKAVKLENKGSKKLLNIAGTKYVIKNSNGALDVGSTLTELKLKNGEYHFTGEIFKKRGSGSISADTLKSIVNTIENNNGVTTISHQVTYTDAQGKKATQTLTFVPQKN